MTSPSLRSIRAIRARGRCQYCGSTEGPFVADHIMPRSRGGSDGAWNRACACVRCDTAKGGKLLAECLVPTRDSRRQYPSEPVELLCQVQEAVEAAASSGLMDWGTAAELLRPFERQCPEDERVLCRDQDRAFEVAWHLYQNRQPATPDPARRVLPLRLPERGR